MPPRVIALFIAAVLLWSGFSTIETPHDALAASTGEAPAWLPAAGDTAAGLGSVADHHLDDLPVQAQADPPTDLPALPVAAHRLGLQPLREPLAAALPTAAAWPPFLAGPLRPPCDGRRFG